MSEVGKHTPGEWEANGLRVVTQRGIIAECPVPQAGGVFEFECSYNARLIAAAPDLLEALALVIGSLSFDREDDLNKEVLRRINAAIQKATEGGR